MNLKLNHLYSKNLNIYGDLGNIIALRYKAKKLGIELEIVNCEIGEEIAEADIYFVGGGQDHDQILVYKDLLRHKDFITNEVNKGKVFLLVCGGYQLFGKFFVDGEGHMIEGLGILNIETKALDTTVASRCIGNIVIELSEEFLTHWEVAKSFSKYIVGFENHGGQTKFLTDTDDNKNPNEKPQPLGKVLMGFGNNSTDKVEGCFYKNIIGTYMHGSVLPKNPGITNAILEKALINKFKNVRFKPDYEELEIKAHEAML